MPDADLREAERLAAAGELPWEELARQRRRRGLKTRDPRTDPRPGDVVRPVSGKARRIVACPPRNPLYPMRSRWREEQPAGWGGKFKAWHCTTWPDGTCRNVHWERLEGDRVSPRGGTLMLSSWKTWARHGTVLAMGAE